MDSNRLILLKTDLRGQMNSITNIHLKLQGRADRFNSADEPLLESIGYQIHNLYGATEDLLKVVAHYFENNVGDASQWHSALLQRMSLEVPGIRPALLSSQSYTILNSLRGFRHFFRHAYGSNIEWEQLQINLNKALTLKALLEEDIQQFLLKFEASSPSSLDR